MVTDAGGGSAGAHNFDPGISWKQFNRSREPCGKLEGWIRRPLQPQKYRCLVITNTRSEDEGIFVGRQGNFVLLEYSYSQQSDLVKMDVLCVPDRTGSSKLVISATIQIIFTITDKLADKKSPTPSLAHDYLFAYPDDATREMASLGLTATTPSIHQELPVAF